MKKTILSVLVGFSVASQAFADDLYQVYQQALKNDPSTLKAAASRDAAFNAIGTAKANLLPQIGLSISAGKAFIDASGSSNSAGVSLTQSLYNPNYYANLDRSELYASQADANYALAQQNLILRTVQAYFAVLQAKDDLAFSEAEKKAIGRQLEQTKQRFSVGLIAKTDVHEAQARYDTASASEISARNNVEIQREAVREITGQYHEKLKELDRSRFSAPQPNPNHVEQWLQKAETHNTQLAAANIGVDISKKEIELARAGYKPTISLSAGVSSSDSTGQLDRSNTGSLGIELSMPLYSGGATDSAVKVARSNFIADSEERERIHRSIEREVRSDFYDVTSSIAQIKAFKQAVISAESALDATEAGFEVGTRTIVDVLNSNQNVYDAKRNLSRARYGYITSILALKLAAGTLTEQDIIDINKGLVEAGTQDITSKSSK